MVGEVVRFKGPFKLGEQEISNFGIDGFVNPKDLCQARPLCAKLKARSRECRPEKTFK